MFFFNNNNRLFFAKFIFIRDFSTFFFCEYCYFAHKNCIVMSSQKKCSECICRDRFCISTFLKSLNHTYEKLQIQLQTVEKNWFVFCHELIVCENRSSWINFTQHKKCSILHLNWIITTMIQMTKSSTNFRRCFKSWIIFLTISDNFLISSKFFQKFLTISEKIAEFSCIFQKWIFFSFDEISLIVLR